MFPTPRRRNRNGIAGNQIGHPTSGYHIDGLESAESEWNGIVKIHTARVSPAAYFRTHVKQLKPPGRCTRDVQPWRKYVFWTRQSFLTILRPRYIALSN